MPNANYANGRVLEYAAKHALEADGYYVVRAASSKGAADLVALKPGEVRLVQCKLQGTAGQAELAKLHQLAALLDAAPPLLASWHKDGRAARTVRFREVFLQLDGKYRPHDADWSADYGRAPVAVLQIGGRRPGLRDLDGNPL